MAHWRLECYHCFIKFIIRIIIINNSSNIVLLCLLLIIFFYVCLIIIINNIYIYIFICDTYNIDVYIHMTVDTPIYTYMHIYPFFVYHIVVCFLCTYRLYSVLTAGFDLRGLSPGPDRVRPAARLTSPRSVTRGPAPYESGPRSISRGPTTGRLRGRPGDPVFLCFALLFVASAFAFDHCWNNVRCRDYFFFYYYYYS